MIKVLYYVDTLMAGGVESQLTELVLRLDRSRFEPTVVYLYGEKVGFGQQFAAVLREKNVSVIALDLRLNTADKLHGIVQIIRHTWRIQPDIVHALNYHSNLLTRLSRLFLPPRLKLLGALRNHATSKQLLYERLSARLCAAIVCNSPALRQQLVVDAHIPAAKVIEIPNGVDVERFANNPEPMLRSEHVTPETRLFVTVGRISHQKAQDKLVEAVGMLAQKDQLPEQTQFWFVGDVHHPEAEAKLNKAIAHDNLQAYFRRFPPTRQPESYYHAADVVILASLWEGLPNVALEALAAGRPVLISEAANAAGIIEHGVNGWIVRTGDVADLAEVLYQVMQLPSDSLTQMRDACIQTAQCYSMQAMVQRYEVLYEHLNLGKR
jgi:glycosyltransferase involved in cell wall biosynthesis